jgi:hypothetical protein
MKKKYFYVPWHKVAGYLGAYCHLEKEMVIRDLNINFCLWDQHWGDLQEKGWKIIKVSFLPYKRKKKV